jgi:hypothetical protein
MATTQNTFTGDGSNLGPFSFTFKWLESTDIKVTVAGVLKTAGTHYNLQSLNYSTKTGGQVLFTAGNAPANGAAIRIYRETDDSDLAATFYSGSAIRAQDLNNNFIQGLYVTQESSNNAAAATTVANAATTTANTALSNSTAAQASAATAISTANSAVSTANSAVSTANSAVSTANAASAAASSAVSTANTANATASSALSAVSEALAYTTVANVAAIPGSPTNGDALRITNSTGIESFTPLIGVPVGFVGNSALTVEIYYNGTSATWIWSRYFPIDPESRYWAGSVVVSDTAPLSPTEDSLWYDSIGGRFYIWYNDGNTSQWVDVSPQGNRTSTFLAGTAALPGLTPEGDSNTGIYSPGADQVAISTNGTGRLFVDSSGRVGIGTTAPSHLLDLLGSAPRVRVKDSSTGATFGHFENNSGNFYIGTDNSTGGSLSAGNYARVIWSQGAYPLVFATNDTQRAQIDSSGRLLVGTSTSIGQGGLLQVVGGDAARPQIHRNVNDQYDAVITLSKARGTGTEAVSNNDDIGSIFFQGANGSAFNTAARIQCSVDGTVSGGGANDMPGRLVFSTTADGASSPTERMRITNAGRVLFGATAPSAENELFSFQGSNGTLSMFNVTGGASQWPIRCWNTAASGTINQILFMDGGGTARGSITTNASSTSYNTTSDYRLKENVELLAGATERLSQIPVHRFNFIGSDATVDGFLAHEVQAIVPECVTGTKDEVDADGNPVYQGIDQSKLVPLLTAALQEAMERIETLQGMVAVNNMTIDEQHYQISALADRLTALEGGTN